MTERHHIVTVTTRLDDEGTEDERRRVDEVRFVCTASEDAECRTYPDCDCEYFHWSDDLKTDVEGHLRLTGRECWISGWFDGDGHVYVGADPDDWRDDQVPAVDRSGPIDVRMVSYEEYIEWEWIS